MELSKRITSESELMNLGIRVLKQPEFIIKTALYNKKEIQKATYEVLSTWEKQQNSLQEAYINLHAGLKKNQMIQLAAELRQWVEGVSRIISETPDERRFQLNRLVYERLETEKTICLNYCIELIYHI